MGVSFSVRPRLQEQPVEVTLCNLAWMWSQSFVLASVLLTGLLGTSFLSGLALLGLSQELI